MRAPAPAAALCLLVLSLSSTAAAQALGELRARAQSMAPEISRAEARVHRAQGLQSEAWAAAFSLGRARFDVRPTPAREGDLIHSAASDDISFSDEMGMWLRFRIYLALPLTSWWRIASALRAARSGVDIAAGDADRARRTARMRLERAYRAAQLAEAETTALRSARRRVSRLLASVELYLDEDLPGIDESDRLRLSLELAELQARVATTQRTRRRASVRVRQVAALHPRTRLDLPALPDPDPTIPPIDWCFESARHGRPEVSMTLAAIRGAEGLVDMRWAELVPDLAIGGYVSFQWAPVVDDQHSPFVQDRWNSTGSGYGLGLVWNADFGGVVSRVRQAQADLAQAHAMRRLALGAVGLDVESAYATARQAEASLEARRRARDAAQNLLDTSQRELDAGRLDPRRATSAVNTWLSQERSFLRARRDYALALAELENASGMRTGTLTD